MRVDLPMPGSPARRVSECPAIPPPMSLSNSGIPVTNRATFSVSIEPTGTGTPEGYEMSPSSSGSLNTWIVFHALHAKQLPLHLDWVCPHSVQNHASLNLVFKITPFSAFLEGFSGRLYLRLFFRSATTKAHTDFFDDYFDMKYFLMVGTFLPFHDIFGNFGQIFLAQGL